MRMMLLAIVCFVLALTTGRADEAKKETATDIRARYAKRSAEILKIVEPVKVSNVYYWKDGGSLGIELTDAKEKKHLFALDGRLKGGPRNLYIGATYPGGQGSKMVEVFGPEESALYGVMLRWANKHPQREALYDGKIDLSGAEHGNLWEVRAFFLRLDQRFVGR